ncbi:hypothetical protein AB0C90_26770 [Streptomyces sp. NPDC048550]|uniref:hypothetical protein n=1 Tax=Streptomyces sp. NPDC048550 TaxID=3155739 RepID=UPI00342D7C10
MTHPFRTRRLVMFVASAAVTAGGALLPTGAFAAVPATPSVAVADTVHLGVPGTTAKHGGKHGQGGKPAPAKNDHIKVTTSGQVQCIIAPCGPSDNEPHDPGPAPAGKPGDVPDDSGMFVEGNALP